LDKRLLRSLITIAFLLSLVNTITAQQPTITSFSPSSGPVGTLVAINGTNLSGTNTIIIGGVNAITVSNNGTLLIAMVMPGAATGIVSVQTNAGTATGNSNYTVTPTVAPTFEQAKLTGTGYIGQPLQGFAVAISADGNTAVVTGRDDNNGIGALWIYTRSGSTWTQQGSKLVPTDYKTLPALASAAISADGNTIIVGGWIDDVQRGGAWVFVRNNGSWSQQGAVITGSNASTGDSFGVSVSISADGNTAIVGASSLGNTSPEGASIFTRTNGTWTQQGPKLEPAHTHVHTPGSAAKNISVALSADGNTAVIALQDDVPTGATWIFTRTGSTWTQQGPKLVGTGSASGQVVYQGRSVATSADGNTVLVGAISDVTGNVGTTWVFVRSGGTWSQQGPNLTGTGYAPGFVFQGVSVSLSADGNIAAIGATAADLFQGAVWIFTRTGSAWAQKGNKIKGIGSTGNVQQGNSVAMSADGKTMIWGGPLDNNRIGAAWIYATNAVSITAVTTDATCGQNNGSITINTADGTAPYRYSIDGQTFILSNSFTGMSSGNYTVTVRDAAGSSNSVAVVIGNTCPVVTGTVIVDDSCAVGKGKITISASKGTAPYRYSIDGIYFQTDNAFTSLTAGNYRIILEDAQHLRDTVDVIVGNHCLQVSVVSVDATCGVANGVITVTASGGTAPYLYSIDGSGFGNSNRFISLPPGNYTITVKDAGAATGIGLDTIHNISVPPVLHLPPDTILCDQTTLLLDATQNGNAPTYTWQDGSTASTYEVKGPGIYFVNVFQNGCMSSDTSNIVYQETPKQIISRDTTKCTNSSIVVDVSFPGAHYTWKDLTISPLYTITNPGFYYCTVSNYCGTTIDTIHVTDTNCECVPTVPNVFSPNGDGINDEFRPEIPCTPDFYQLRIFNRGGQVVFESTTLTGYWKGTFRNKPVPIGTYYYILKVRGRSDPLPREKAGSITVIR
jgi:gliding motility-associated-like protein